MHFHLLDNILGIRILEGENEDVGIMLVTHKALGSIANKLHRDQIGQTMVEYVLLIVLIALALAVFFLSPNVRDSILMAFQNTSSAL